MASQDDAALRAEQRLHPPGIGRGQGPQLIVAVQEVGDVCARRGRLPRPLSSR